MMSLLLLDISDPRPSSVGVAEVAILALLVLAITVVLISGLVLFLVWRKRHTAASAGPATNSAFQQSAQ